MRLPSRRGRSLEFAILSTTLLIAAAFAGPGVSASAPPMSEETRQDLLLTSKERDDLLKGRVVLRDIPSPGMPGKAFEALGVLPGGFDEAYAVITDYRRYPEFMPAVGNATVIEVNGDASVVEIRLILPLGQSRQYRLKYMARRTADEIEVAWVKMPWPELSASQTIQDTSGRWLVRKFESGGLLAAYRVYTDLGPVPFGLTDLASALGRKSLPDVIRKTRQRILFLFPAYRKPGPAQNS
jgi:ribosome-associated toxin RatA of RatAB toxin-antitoxin module